MNEPLLQVAEVIRAELPARGALHHEMPAYMRRAQQQTNVAHQALDALVEELTAHRQGRSPTAKLLDRAIKALRVKDAALETIRAELDLPEHLAEVVGDALAKEAGHRAGASPRGGETA